MENKDLIYEEDMQCKNPKFGKMSLIFSGIGFGIYVIYTFILYRFDVITAKGPRILLFFFGTPILSKLILTALIIGLFWGIFGLFQKKSKKSLCIVGIITNLFLLMLGNWNYLFSIILYLMNTIKS